MSSKDNKYKKRYRLFFILSIIALVGLIFIIITLDTELSKYQENGYVSGSEYETLAIENQKLKKLSSIVDLWLLENKVKEALTGLKSLNFADDELNSLKEKKIKRLKEILQSNSDDQHTRMNLRSELSQSKEKRDSLSIAIDSLQQNFKLKYSQAQDKSDSLELALKKAERQLNRRETLRVISFKSDKGILVHYIGETKNDMANGSGIGVWSNGSIYRGEWTNNEPNGEGEYKWADGARYVGDFENGERSGEGIFYYVTGERYEGEFQNGLRSGQGTLYDIDGNKSFSGQWKNDKPIQ